MDAIEAILTRRSVRCGFGAQAVPQATVDTIVASGLHAPSSKDDQPWRITPVTDRRVLREVAERMLASPRLARYVPIDPNTGEAHAWYHSSVAESAAILAAVPLALVVENVGSFTGGRSRIAAATGDLQEVLVGYAFEYLGLGAAVQNMLLAAHALGLSAVFIGDVVIVEHEARDILALRGELAGLIAAGYSAEPAHADKQIRPEGAGDQIGLSQDSQQS